MFALDVREGIAVNTLQGLDPQTLFPDKLRQTGAIRRRRRLFPLGGIFRLFAQNRNILFLNRLHFPEFQAVGFNRFADRLEMVVPGRHVRVPEILLELGVRALTPANQPDCTATHVRPFGACSGQLFNRQVPMAVCPTFLIKPDFEENQGLHLEVRTQLNQYSPDLGFGEIGQPYIAIQEGPEFGSPHLAGHLVPLHKKYRRIPIGCLVGRHHCTFSTNRRFDTTRQNPARCSILS